MRKKPPIRYVDMCIWIDENAYKEDIDTEKFFTYLQYLFYALAIKKRFFNKESDYDNYSIYGATQIYSRYINKKQFLPDDAPGKLPKIKSVLNYIKKTLYPLKVNYEQDNYGFAYCDDKHGDYVNEGIEKNMIDDITQYHRTLLQVDIETYFKHLPRTIMNVIKESPYSNDRVMVHNLYMSCLITLLRCLTLSNHNRKRLTHRDELEKINTDDILERLYYEEALNSVVVWNLPDNFKSYINVLTNRLKNILVRDIKDLIKDMDETLTPQIIQDIMMEPYSDYVEEK